MKTLLQTFFVCIIIIVSNGLSAQNITIHADEYKHQFEGAGVSIGLYMGHHFSMNTNNQDKAIRLINQDLNMKYLQAYIDPSHYIGDQSKRQQYFDRRANYIKSAKQYREDIQFSLAGNIFPDDLRKDFLANNGNTYRILNTDDPEIYDKLAAWYFEIFQEFYDRGVEVDVFNVINEPDLPDCGANKCRRYLYGFDDDTRRGASLIFTEAVPKFKAMLADPNINTSNMKMPLIMGPSSFSPEGCLNYIRYFKNNYPEAWDQIDIVATHQYTKGGRVDLFQQIIGELDGRAFHQSENHASKSDPYPVSDGHKAALSLSRLIGTAVNNGVEAWYYFQNVYPQEFTLGGLVRVKWASDNPIPYKQYYSFKQITSSQPANSHVMGYEASGATDAEVLVFRKQGEDTVYLHYTNFTPSKKKVTFSVQEGSENRTISSLDLTMTDESENNVISLTQSDMDVTEASLEVEPYSINTIKIGMASVITSLDSQVNAEDVTFSLGTNNHIQVNSRKSKIQQIDIYSMQGKLIESTRNVDAFETSLPKLSTGDVYIVQVYTGNRVTIRKFLLN
ncbi:MAG: T9SS type A sorting domain-containing protein [Bacteroidota bacterium]